MVAGRISYGVCIAPTRERLIESYFDLPNILHDDMFATSAFPVNVNQ